MMTRIKKAFAALRQARRHLEAAGAPPHIIAALDELMAKLSSL
jgi:hypothetical protein